MKLLFSLALSLICGSINAQLSAPITIDESITTSQRKIVLFDVDNDALKDIVISGYFNDIVWYKNLGNGFSSSQNITSTVTEPYHLDFGDINGDGFNDLLVTNKGAYGGVSVFVNNGGVSWTESEIDSVLPYCVNSYFIDVENDGDLDIICCSDLSINLYKNDGLGIFTNPIIINDNLAEFYTMTVNDFNNDGFKDLVINSGSVMGILLFLNNTSGTFNAPITVESFGLRFFITSFDIDNDNDIDLIDGNSIYNFGLDFFENDGLGSFVHTFSESQPNCADEINIKTCFSDLNNNKAMV